VEVREPSVDRDPVGHAGPARDTLRPRGRGRPRRAGRSSRAGLSGVRTVRPWRADADGTPGAQPDPVPPLGRDGVGHTARAGHPPSKGAVVRFVPIPEPGPEKSGRRIWRRLGVRRCRVMPRRSEIHIGPGYVMNCCRILNVHRRGCIPQHDARRISRGSSDCGVSRGASRRTIARASSRSRPRWRLIDGGRSLRHPVPGRRAPRPPA
jgi:hypothetical protein